MAPRSQFLFFLWRRLYRRQVCFSLGGQYMDTIQILTLKTTNALGKLADLQRRAETASEKMAPVIRPALKELTGALEELQVANEHLQSQVDELASVRWKISAAEQRLEEFANAVPVPCLWTDAAGVIDDGNAAACALLNISRQRLPGKPLMLFITNRDTLFAAMEALRRGGPSSTVEIELTVRPRERRPRPSRVIGRTTEHDARWTWFIQDVRAIEMPSLS
jgi:PAS domain-containing protein